MPRLASSIGGRVGAGSANHGAQRVIPKAERAARAASAGSAPSRSLIWEDAAKWR
jgi:hypothetical protein